MQDNQGNQYNVIKIIPENLEIMHRGYTSHDYP